MSSAHDGGMWQKIMSDIAREWNTSEIDLMNEAMTDLHAKYNKKRQLLIGRTAMIVDDSVMMRMMMEEWLAKAGVKVSAKAENGYEAIKFFNSEEHFDYVFLNIIMPEMDGIEALTDLKKDRESTIIMVTTTKHPELLLKSVENGAHYVLYRPFGFGTLLTAMCTDLHFYPESHEILAGKIAAMGKDTNDLTTELTQEEVHELAVLAASSRRRV